MNYFFAKISLYDLLTTVLVGSVLVYASWNCRVTLFYFDRPLSEPVFICASFLTGLVFHKCVELLTSHSFEKNRCFICMILLSLVSRNYLALIRKAYSDVRSELNLADQIKIDISLSDYYDAYYSLLEKNQLGAITTIEAHSAFIKDMFFSLLISAPIIAPGHYIIDHISCEWLIYCILVILFIVLFSVARFQCEYKIHRLVWEGHLMNNRKNQIKIIYKE